MASEADKVAEDGISLDIMKDACKNAISSVFDEEQKQPYDHNLAQVWVNKICEHAVARARKDGKPYKFIANCVICKKVGAGVHIASSAHFSATDGSVTEVYDIQDHQVWVAVTLWWMQL